MKTPGRHKEGVVDPRIEAFYEQLRRQFPDNGPIDVETSPWMSTPLDIGIDHVIMSLSFSSRSDAAIESISELAALHGLVLFDPQFDEIHVPGLDVL